MAFSYGRKFRRIAAEALSADPAEMRALRQRILPPRGEQDVPVLRIENEADLRAAPAAIVSAFFADELTGDEAADLLKRVDSPQVREQTVTWRDWDAAMPAEVARMSPPERKRAGYVWPREQHPLAEAIRAWGEEARRGAANGGGGLVKNNENTSAAAHGDASR